MIIQEKEIIYKLQSKGFEIYKDNVKENFLIMKHVCNCKESWFTNKKQCIFCGSLGYNVKICKDMHISKLAAKGQTCTDENCSIRGEDLEVGCINSQCPSNTNPLIKELVIKVTQEKSKSKGIFSTKSAFSVSQAICFFCGKKSSQFVCEELDIYIAGKQDKLKEKFRKSKKIFISKINNKFVTKLNDEDDNIEEKDDIDIAKISNKLFSQLFI